MNAGYTIKDIVADYVKEHPEYSESTIKTILTTVTDVIVEDIFKGNRVRIYPVGEFYICRFKPKKAPVNYHLTKKYGKVIKHNNMHTKGYSFKCNYIRCYNSGAVYWRFSLTRRLSRQLPKVIAKNGIHAYSDTTVIKNDGY